jgi:hypothetical protein
MEIIFDLVDGGSPNGDAFEFVNDRLQFRIDLNSLMEMNLNMPEQLVLFQIGMIFAVIG